MNYVYLIDFLGDLSRNNNREWFGANKERYNLSLEFYKQEVKRLIDKIAEFDSDIAYLKPENCIFRIYRDIRFSPNKIPYKTHFGAYIARNGGRKSPYAGYYLHIDAEQSFLSGGAYNPSKEVLSAIRHEIDVNYDELSDIVSDSDFRKYFGKIEPYMPPLKKFPAGFSATSPAGELLRYKDFIIEHPLEAKTICSADFTDYAARIFHAMKPCNDFFNSIIADYC